MKRFLAILLALTLLPVPAAFSAAQEPQTISPTDYALVDEMWDELNGAEERVMRSAANATTAQAVAAAAQKSELYVQDSLRWNGDDHFTFETTVGVTCGYSARLRNQAFDAVEDAQALAEPETQTASYATKNAPGGKDVYLIEPYYGLDSSFTKQYQNEAQNIAKATGGTYTCYTKTAATIDAVADAIESGAVVIFDSHGDTDYARGEDYTTGATTSYLLLQTGTGLTATDYANDNGTYHAVNYGKSGKMYYYAVDGTCIANHMDSKAPNSFVWMAICLGMATDGMEKPLIENGVGVVYGYSQSVTFDYDYLWEECFWDEMIAGETVASAIATMKEKVGKWDYCSEYLTISQARRNYAAFPIVVSSEDVYPGHGNVDDLQTVYSTWTLLDEKDGCTHESTKTVTKEANCTEDGYVRVVCNTCGETVSEMTLEKLDHDYDVMTVDPTCTEKGYDLCTCSRCGDEYKENYKDALGHDYAVTTVAPTCTEQGYEHFACLRCGNSFDGNYTDALGHADEDGNALCDRCGADLGTQKPVDPIDPDKPDDPIDPVVPVNFSDVIENDWFYGAVAYSVEHGLMNGMGGGLFEPEGEVTRAMLVTILYRNAGEPDVQALSNPFTDVPEGEWYTSAVIWAANEGIVKGMTDSSFEPNTPITREQIATILYRFSGEPETENTELAFPDAKDVSEYARNAVCWAVSEGLLQGMDGKLMPGALATRAQIATILMRYLEA